MRNFITFSAIAAITMIAAFLYHHTVNSAVITQDNIMHTNNNDYGYYNNVLYTININIACDGIYYHNKYIYK